MFKLSKAVALLSILILIGASSCDRKTKNLTTDSNLDSIAVVETDTTPPIRGQYTAPFGKDITIGKYFCTMDSLVIHYDTLTSHPITEHLIVQANPWLIDSLAATDYYSLKEKGRIVNDQRAMVILHATDSLLIPDAEYVAELQAKQDSILIDVNVPEFKLRIFRGSDTLYVFPVRVGQNKKKFLKMAGYVVSLQTDLGAGTIVRIERNPCFINPVDGHKYYSTLRDDGNRTELPQIPWLETELNGIRTGDMIHPTTNPVTLGKAWSNGCIGTREGDAWRIYYHAPLGTRVQVRYDLHMISPNRDTTHLPDIYEKGDKH